MLTVTAGRKKLYCLLTGMAIIIILVFLSFGFTGILSGKASTNPGEELFFTILHTNDEHSSVIPHSSAVDYHPVLENPSIGGYGRLATAVEQVRAEKSAGGEPVLLLNGGDFLGGSPFAWLIPQGLALELTLKQEIGYNAVAIGNHEYDYGADILAVYLQAAGYPENHDRTAVLAANTVAPPTHPLAELDLYRDTHLLELENGLKVGLFGIIGKDAVSVTSQLHEPVTFTDQHEAAREAVAKLQARGAEVIIALSHSGVSNDEDQAMAREVPGIHVIVSGHCHTALHEPVIENGTVIVQAGSLLRYMGRLELAYNRDTDEVRVRNGESGTPYLVELDSSFAVDPLIEALIEEYTRELNSLVTVTTGGRFLHIMDTVAVSDFEIPDKPPMQETPFGNFVTDAMRLVSADKLGERVDVAIQANGNIRGGVTPGTMDHSRGKIAFYDLAELVGLGIGPDGSAGYPVVSFYLTGEELRRALEVAALLPVLYDDIYFLQFSGLRYNFNPRNVILLTVPFINQPVPSAALGFGAVAGAELYTGEGLQGTGDEGYIPLKRGDEQLYHVVTDSYILSFLPMAGEVLPSLTIEPKDRDGNVVPLERFDEFIVRVDGEELKVWQTVIEHAANPEYHSLNAAGIPQINQYYAGTADRINPTGFLSYAIWLVIILLVIAALITFLVIRGKRRKKARLAAAS